MSDSQCQHNYIEVCKFHYARKPVPITISSGLAEFAEGDTMEYVFKRADHALFAAKKKGRNQLVNENRCEYQGLLIKTRWLFLPGQIINNESGKCLHAEG